MQLLTVKETQQRLKVGRNVMYKLLNNEGFPSIRINNKFYVNEQELDQWISENTRNKVMV